MGSSRRRYFDVELPLGNFLMGTVLGRNWLTNKLVQIFCDRRANNME
jgi:hypothetical protein